MDINLVALWSQMGLPVRLVVGVLTVQALLCLTVVFDRMFVLWKMRKGYQTLIRAVAEMDDNANTQQVEHLVATPKTALDRLVLWVITSFRARLEAGHSIAHASDSIRRALERRMETLSIELNRGMNVLASTGSTAPFVGLLGTVLGIIHAFKMISSSGSGGIGSIGSAIGESLIVTGYGLVVAIPTVLVFNWLQARLSEHEHVLASTCADLLDRLEGSTRVVPHRRNSEFTLAAAE